MNATGEAARLKRRGEWLEWVTLGWNVVGAGVIFTAAHRAHSVALAGFGLDSIIEIGASTLVLWQLRGVGDRRRERLALRGIGAAFFLLAVYLFLQSAPLLLGQARVRPEPSLAGAGWLALTCAAMLALAAAKAGTGRQLGEAGRVLRAEARVTLIDAFLAAGVLAGVGLNAAFGWWWADGLAAVGLAVYGLAEGGRAWAEKA